MGNPTERRFNLVDEAWIPVAGEGRVSLMRIFSDPSLKALGGNPVEKISIMKFLLAIAQAAHTPEDEEDLFNLGCHGLAAKAAHYLDEKRDLFWLYGDKPFLQMPSISQAEIKSTGTVKLEVSTGNTTVLTEDQIEKKMDDGEKALLLIFLSCLALGGKKADNSIVLSKGYMGKSNKKGKPSSAKAGPSLGYLGYLHNFICGRTLWETVWLNMLTKNNVKDNKQFSEGIGLPPWEAMPEGEDCARAKTLKNSLMGRLVPLCRFVLLTTEGIHYSEGIAHLSHKDNGIDPSIAVDFSNDPKAIWTDPEKRPWRQITSLLSFLNANANRSFECIQLSVGVLRARKAVPEFRIWSGGIKVTSNPAGEQFLSGNDDFVESEIILNATWLGDIWFTYLKTEIETLESIANEVKVKIIKYFKKDVVGKKKASEAANIFWQLCERKFQQLVDACGEDSTGNKAVAMRRLFVEYADRAFDAVCPRDTARQMEAWAANRPNLGRFLKTDIKQ
ncbi:MAG: type I-E CRISPR-associated protein Cse1/CasA [Clostridiaceae bacterium]|nr:type I-E CRISPR-associated protein Cse1/CasA [Clostridiaceae bacterium]